MKRFLLVILGLIVVIFTSWTTSYLVTRNQANIHFVSAPKLDNSDYGYLEINGKRYRQLYTTTQVEMGNGLHYHRIDVRSSDRP